jgi:ubiquinol-cytochrome c reductase iron-sulfur subunit
VRRFPLVVAGVLLGRRRRRARPAEEEEERIVGEGEPRPGAELAVVALLLAAAGCAVAFVVLYAVDSLAHPVQWMGLALGLALIFLSAAFTVGAKELVVDEDAEEDYPEPKPEDAEEVRRIAAESTSRITRKRLLLGAGGLAGTSLGAALITPAASLGPVLDTGALSSSAWRRGKRLVDERNRPFRAGEIESGSFYTAYPEGEGHDRIDSPVIVVRVDPATLKLASDRRHWAPEGIVAFSKICTHAGCAISEYRTPLFAPTQPRPALVCPCHYSTFDPAAGGDVIFGPAGRPLPQLPLAIDPATGELRAAGVFSGPVGPAWPGVRDSDVRYEPSGPEGAR